MSQSHDGVGSNVIFTMQTDIDEIKDLVRLNGVNSFILNHITIGRIPKPAIPEQEQRQDL